MTTWQKAIKYAAMAFAVFLIVSILGGIIGAVGLISGLSGKSDMVGDMKTYSVAQNITELVVDVNAADIAIVSGAEFSVESNLTQLVIKDADGTLKVSEKSDYSWGKNYNGPVLTIQIPTEHVFETAWITTGAGRLELDSLTADKITLELGAGEVKIEELNAVSEVEISGGAGAITISGGTLSHLDLDMGVGELKLTAEITGDSELDLGMGETTLVLLGSEQDYKLDFDKGLGSITVDGTRMDDGGVWGSGKNTIDIDGGVGRIHVSVRDAS